MSENTKIEWADHTFNPWEGCQKVGPGCDHCYAEARNARFGGGQAINWGPGAPRRRTSASNWAKPQRWNAGHAEFFAQHGRRQRVFCASLADVFDNAVPDQWRADLFTLISETPHLDWLLLTKRVGNVARMLPVWWEDPAAWPGGAGAHANVWLGITVVNQAEADRDIPKLLAVPARVRFLSIEPLLGPINLADMEVDQGAAYLDPLTYWSAEEMTEMWGVPTPEHNRIDWVICGGESGPQARPMHPDWARSLRDQCDGAGVPFLFKQWGEWVPRGPVHWGYPIVENVPRFRMTDRGENGQDLAAEGGNHVWMNRAGKKAAGRLLDGRTHDAFPATGPQP